MYRVYQIVEMVLLLLLSHLDYKDPNLLGKTCSRRKSHIVRTVIEKKVYPIFQRYKVPIPLACPFHSKRHMLWWPLREMDFQSNHWECPVCASAFDIKEDLVQHYDTNHKPYLTDDLLCLGDFCDVFRCNILSNTIDFEKAETTISETSMQQDSLFRNFYCDDGNMSLLRTKCRAVIKQCLFDVSASASSKDFQDIEDELHSSICSYLTCHRYWDSSLKEAHRVPLIYCLFLLFTLVFIFCLSYNLAALLLNNHHPTDILRSNGYLQKETVKMKPYRSKFYNSLRAQEHVNLFLHR